MIKKDILKDSCANISLVELKRFGYKSSIKKESGFNNYFSVPPVLEYPFILSDNNGSIIFKIWSNSYSGNFSPTKHRTKNLPAHICYDNMTGKILSMEWCLLGEPARKKGPYKIFFEDNKKSEYFIIKDKERFNNEPSELIYNNNNLLFEKWYYKRNQPYQPQVVRHTFNDELEKLKLVMYDNESIPKINFINSQKININDIINGTLSEKINHLWQLNFK
jgi:hypothetical protein